MKRYRFPAEVTPWACSERRLAAAVIFLAGLFGFLTGRCAP